ncbi:MAG: hypothetical protein LV480_07210 [Methylacidiphilales bacterium]|nr:hypothetical protein [Candidatus Methylacidiphilales bacterium]
MSLPIEIITVSGCAAGTMISVSALLFELFQKARPKREALFNCRQEILNPQAILKSADKDIEDRQYQIEQLANTLGDKVEPEQIQKTKSLLDQVLKNLHRIPRRALE